MNHRIETQLIEQQGMTVLQVQLPPEIQVSKHFVSAISGHGDLLVSVKFAERTGGGATLTYHAGSRMTLAKYLMQSVLESDACYRILRGVITPLAYCRETGLFLENFSHDLDHMFIDSLNQEVRLVYFPFETQEQAPDSFGEMMMRLIREMAVVDPADRMALEWLMEQCLLPRVTPGALLKFLDQLHQEWMSRNQNGEGNPKGFWNHLLRRVAGAGHKPAGVIARGPERPKATAVSGNPLRKAPQNPTEGAGASAMILSNSTTTLFHDQPPVLSLSVSTRGMTTHMELRSYPCIIGRGVMEADLVLEDPSASRKHGVIDWQEGKLLLTDCQSKNGIRVNGCPLGPNGTATLTTGDLILIGTSELLVLGISDIG